MAETVNLHYRKVPTLSSFFIPFKAFVTSSPKFSKKEDFPLITLSLEDHNIDRTHLSRFNKICSIAKSNSVSPIYPLTLAFPFFQKILSLKQTPISILKILGKQLRVIQFKRIKLDEPLAMNCSISEVRILANGLEIDLSAIINVNGEIVWKATETFFYRGNFGEPDENIEKYKFEAIPQAELIDQWYLKSGIGFRFARISGDSNGIHYSKRYAQLFGFERDFAQPFLILGRAMNHLLDPDEQSQVSLFARLKGQFYYERNVIIKGLKSDSKTRFDIYSEGNDRPCLNGAINTC